MSTFSVKVLQVLHTEKHPDADRLDINKILGFTCISNKKEDGSSRYKVGDLVVYIPSDSVLPEWLLKRLDMWNEEQNKGILSGSKGNRVRPVRLRGIFSEGILFPVYSEHGYYVIDTETTTGHCLGRVPQLNESNDSIVGLDVAELLGITKYEPVIPSHMAGQVFNADSKGATPVKYDIESYENYPNVFRPNEEVVVLEKIHGTFCGIGLLPDFEFEEAFRSIHFKRNVIVYSKGMGAGGKCFKDVEENSNNLYVKAYCSLSLEQLEKFHKLAVEYDGLHLLGEVAGPGVQDLHYGFKKPELRIFDIYLGKYPFGRYANFDELEEMVEYIGLNLVPNLIQLPYDYDSIVRFRDGKDSISNSNIREGVVVRPIFERRDNSLGRVQLKFVSPHYKLRKSKNATEFN